MTDLIEKLNEARKLLYIHGMLTQQENERAKKRVEKMAERVEATHGE